MKQRQRSPLLIALLEAGGLLCLLGLLAGILLQTRASGVDASGQPEPAGPPIWGNRRSGIYHLPGCSGYPKVENPLAHWRAFTTEDDAQREGYRRALNCAPIRRRRG
jgi:hypothetical protein